jgi:hypothetical protein
VKTESVKTTFFILVNSVLASIPVCLLVWNDSVPDITGVRFGV